MAGDQRRGDRVAGVGDGHRGQAQDARLRVPVGREGAVPVGVVVGDVEDDGGGRRERGGPVQLEAGELDGDDVVGGRAVVLDGGDDLDQRAPDVPGGDGAAAVGQQDRLEHGDRRRLAVGAGDREPRRGRAVGARHPQPPGELRFADRPRCRGAAASTSSGASGRQPGEVTTRSVPSGTASSGPSQLPPAATSSATTGGSAASVSSTRAPRRRSTRAAAAPETPRPATRTVRPRSSLTARRSRASRRRTTRCRRRRPSR